MKRIRVLTPQVVPGPDPADASGPVALCFSGGLDSWYSLLKHQTEVSALLTVKGFDIPVDDRTIWPELMGSNQEIATATRKQLITVETDLRAHLDPDGGCFNKHYPVDFWGQCMHGACLAAAGLFLQDRFKRVIIASSWPFIRLQPWGSSPLLDPLWSNGRVGFLHDGAEASRLEKARLVARSDMALRHLRVCCANIPGRYNCCECDKCVRTMLALHLFGGLERAVKFPKPLDLRALRSLQLKPYIYPLYRDILQEAEACGNEAVANLVRILLRERFCFRQQWERVAQWGRGRFCKKP